MRVPGNEPFGVVVFDRKLDRPDDVSYVLRTANGHFPTTPEEVDALKATWLFPSSRPTTVNADPAAVRASWEDQFKFVEEELHPDKRVKRPGLRPPQIGGVYAALAHWKVGNEPATIVMPTGTGKTETMLALCVHQRLERLLVVVPNDALRDQIGEKFVTLGLLRDLGVVQDAAQYPIVCRLKHIPKNAQQVNDLFGPCNVVVTTMPVLSGCDNGVLGHIVHHCSHLFIDEAHHVSAPTWERVKRAFQSKTVLQFTATPFREDNKHVEGTVIFNYPLRKAQEEEYFKPIEFRSVWSFDPQAADEKIAREALAALTRDLAHHDHLIMARASSTSVADRLHELYVRLAPERQPVVIHSDRPAEERKESLVKLRSRQSRVVVCVNMFGEGFDFPELKIAALHELHKSLAITLQFTGRFTRSKPALGNATVVANLADVQVQKALRGLYAEDADWNVLLRDLSTGAVGGQQRFSAFVQDFAAQPKRYALANLTPKMSTVVYRTGPHPAESWNPEHITDVIDAEDMLEAPAINAKARVAVFITQNRDNVDWGAVRDLVEVTWDLYVLHWNEARRLLFVHSTAGDTLHKELAEAVSGRVELIRGEQVFRVFAGITRLMLTNLGLKDVLGRARRFSMHVGSDVLEAIRETQQGRNKAKSNLFGYGFRGGERVSAGASLKGKLWAHQVADHLEHWLAWCDETGERLLDDTIDVNKILNTAVKFVPLDGRPDAAPLAIDWSTEVLANSQSTVRFDINGQRFSLYEVGLRVLTDDATSPIRFALEAEGQSAVFEIEFEDAEVRYIPVAGTVEVQAGKRVFTLHDWFHRAPPDMYFSDRYVVEDHMLAQLSPPDESFPRDRIEAWDWRGVNLRAESQGPERDPTTVQYKVIQEIRRVTSFDIVFDDDESGEAADIIAIRVDGRTIEVHFYHCKYSLKATAGERVKDLYEVCGQTQRSIHWRDVSLIRLFQHMRHRENLRTRAGKAGRFEAGAGDLRKLKLLEGMVPLAEVKFHISIVQPGLSKANATSDQLELLAATELYLSETYQIPFRVIGSA